MGFSKFCPHEKWCESQKEERGGEVFFPSPPHPPSFFLLALAPYFVQAKHWKSRSLVLLSFYILALACLLSLTCSVFRGVVRWLIGTIVIHFYVVRIVNWDCLGNMLATYSKSWMKRVTVQNSLEKCHRYQRFLKCFQQQAKGNWFTQASKKFWTKIHLKK